jgi:hypothetical protein
MRALAGMDATASIAARVADCKALFDAFLRRRVWHINQPGDLALREEPSVVAA